jgi:hypothetical protein
MKPRIGNWYGKEESDSKKIVERIAANEILEILEHRTRKNQKIFAINLNGRIHAVPFLLDESGNIILKTIYPSRKLQRIYGKKKETR